MYASKPHSIYRVNLASFAEFNRIYLHETITGIVTLEVSSQITGIEFP